MGFPDEPAASPFLVPFDGTFRIGDRTTTPPDGAPKKKDNQAALAAAIEQLSALQRRLYADNRTALLLVFQAMDAAGKDGTIREVMSGVNPAGVEVHSFKAPVEFELEHDFLWRQWRVLPPRGHIGIFNRSHYEEVLAVRVNPEYLGNQRLPRVPARLEDLWEERFESIRDAERHWARNGTVIVKFFLYVSKEEQKQRFLERIDDPDDNWKFSAGDLVVRKQWDAYLAAYQAALNATSRPWAPWYCIPADSKSFMRRAVAEIVVATLERIDPRFPAISDEERAELQQLRSALEND